MMAGALFTRAAPALAVRQTTKSPVAVQAGKCYHVEITVNEREPEDAALRRFRRACSSAKIVYEVRRRRTFENPQDIKKRKMKERGFNKKVPPPQLWEEVNGTLETAPFSDLFGEPEDIFAAENSMLTPGGGRR